MKKLRHCISCGLKVQLIHSNFQISFETLQSLSLVLLTVL